MSTKNTQSEKDYQPAWRTHSHRYPNNDVDDDEDAAEDDEGNDDFDDRKKKSHIRKPSTRGQKKHHPQGLSMNAT